ncbi:hypothetical protein HPB50_007788 [Hyalomma asiaticum]|uniref:Uncharacterized protein n=1 Tax=Hyalomma asiaticum TaxID=266040 RepID=A0ACB7RSH9_HYAAI|nr:hypothetical protein HPB50_007788 [Hyalomma asiaticum]
MQRQDTVMRKAISLEKRVALYRLATSAEDRTVANLFGVSRSSVNIIFREFCDVVVRCLEARLVRLPLPQEMKEHLRQAFNYHLSSARRVVENAFGRLKARFRILHKGLEADIDNVNRIIRACCILHNICEELSDHCDVTWMDYVLRQGTGRPQPVCTSRQERPQGVEVREALAKHFAAHQSS